MTQDEKQQEINEYLEQVKIFKETAPLDADLLLEAKEGHIVYIGRETCPYCRRFVKKLSALAKEHDLAVHYVHARPEAGQEEVDALREKYDVPTVPGLLYSSATADLTVKCDSSLEPEEILEIVEVQA